MSNIVGGEFLLGEQEKAQFVQRMWHVADFLGVEILDYVVMSNHYHQLIYVPAEFELTDAELLERLRKYYGDFGLEYLRFRNALERKGRELRRLRKSHLKRMGKISEFQKTLKHGFSSWYNKRKKRRGTLWMERFKSVLAEDTYRASTTIALYIDLNPVRAQMVTDPANYRFCGYGAAMAGDKRCQRGIKRVLRMNSWKEASKKYRIMLMERGHLKVEGKAGSISRELLLETLEAEGQLPLSDLLMLRVRYLSDGLVLGSQDFVEKVFQQYRSHFGEKRKSGARPIKALPDSGLHVIRDLKKSVIS